MTNLFRKAFSLDENEAYQAWRSYKLSAPVTDLSQLTVHIDDPFHLQSSEKKALLSICNQYGLVIYRLSDVTSQDKTLVSALGAQLGLNRLDANLRSDEDAVSSLHVKEQVGNQYIPYTNKALSWHTDGYYNKPECQINAFIIHCAMHAVDGGENHVLDHELMYLTLRDENPEYIQALMHPEAMTIPANIEFGEEIRAAETGPVFSLHEKSGRLHMRFSARKRNIIWRDDETTRAAVVRMNEILADESITVRVALKSGQGIVNNNVLHNRSGFNDSDSQKRLMYRARYYDRLDPAC